MRSLPDSKITNSWAQDAIPLPDDRRQALKIWLFANGLSVSSLARILDITPSALQQALGRDRMPVRNHQALIDAGIPAHLLPHPQDIRPGPKQGQKAAADTAHAL